MHFFRTVEVLVVTEVRFHLIERSSLDDFVLSKLVTELWPLVFVCEASVRGSDIPVTACPVSKSRWHVRSEQLRVVNCLKRCN